MAPAAHAAGVTMAFGPTPTSATIVNRDVSASATNAATAYGFKVTGTTSTDKLHIAALTGPGNLFVERIAASADPEANATGAAFGGTATSTAGASTFTTATDPSGLDGEVVKISKSGETTDIAVVTGVSGAGPYTVTLDRPISAHTGAAVTDVADPSADDAFLTVRSGSTAEVVQYANSTNVDNIYVGATVPGTYTFQLFKDHNLNGVYDSSQDDASPVFTLNVKDVTGDTTETTDDWSPTVTVPSSLGLGQSVTASISASGLTDTDTRGANGSTGYGKLGEAQAGALTVAFAQTAGISDVAAAPSYDGSAFTKSSTATSSATNPVITTITGVGASNVTRSTTIIDSGVDSLDEDVTDITGSVMDDGTTAARAANIKTGFSTVTYTATVKDGGVAVNGATVYFTLTPGTNTPVLTADGTLISDSSGTKMYSATSNADGVATLKVTSSVTTAGTTYDVDMSSNSSNGDTLTGTYADASADSITVDTPTAELSPIVGGTVALRGTLWDQFGQAFQPPTSSDQQVQVDIDQNNTVLGGSDVTGFATLSGGMFSYSYTPSTDATEGRQDFFRFRYTGPIDATSSVYWTSATAAASVTIASPASATHVTQKKATAAVGAGTAITGTVLDSVSAGLAYKSVTLTGSEGVWFSTASTPTTGTSDDLKSSLTVAANASGVYTAYAFFGKMGDAMVTATSGDASKSVDLVVDEADDQYKVVAIDTAVEPGGISVVSGEVKNGWGYPVAGVTVDLSLNSAIAVLGASSVVTNSEGQWSTSLTGASSADGEATLTAMLNGFAANPTADASWLDDAGVTIPDGFYMDTATVRVDANLNETTISGPESRKGSGPVDLSGNAKPGSSVEIYAKAAGSASAYALVGIAAANESGEWSSTEYITKSTLFFAKTSVSTSTPITVMVTVAAKPNLKFVTATPKGNGLVLIALNGNGDNHTLIRYFRQDKVTKWKQFKWMYAASNGARSYTIKASKGQKTFRIAYTTSGGTAYMNVNVTVK